MAYKRKPMLSYDEATRILGYKEPPVASYLNKKALIETVEEYTEGGRVMTTAEKNLIRYQFESVM